MTSSKETSAMGVVGNRQSYFGGLGIELDAIILRRNLTGCFLTGFGNKPAISFFSNAKPITRKITT